MLRTRLDSYLIPRIGHRPIGAVTAQELLGALRRIEARGRHETAHRVRSLAGRVLRYAVATGRAERDVAADLKGALAPVLFVRPGELRAARWQEFDLDAKEPQWRIPAALLRALQPMTGRGQLLFPSVRTSARPISDNTLNAALRRLGYSSDQMTAHGFRSIASTLLNEQGFAPDIIELQLAHRERNKVRAAYNRAQRLRERREMMQKWADYLDSLRAQTRASVAVC